MFFSLLRIGRIKHFLSAAKCLKKCRKLPKVMEWSVNLKVFEQ